MAKSSGTRQMKNYNKKEFVANSAEGTVVPVTIGPETVNELGYDRVRFEVKVSGPEGSTAQLLAKDSNSVEPGSNPAKNTRHGFNAMTGIFTEVLSSFARGKGACW